MQEKSKDLLTSAQRFSLYIIAVTFIILIWRMISLGVLLKVCLLCISGVFVFSLILEFPDNYGYVSNNSSKWLTILVTAIVFLFVPLCSNIIYDSHKKVYLKSPPSNGESAFKITYKTQSLGGAGNVGGEWTKRHFFND